MLIYYCGTIIFLIDVHDINNWYFVSKSFFVNASEVYFLQDVIITDKKVPPLPAINRYYQALVRDIGGNHSRKE